MSITFNTPLQGDLVPFHYVEFSSSPSTDAMASMPQTILLVCKAIKDEKAPLDLVYSYAESLEKKLWIPPEIKEGLLLAQEMAFSFRIFFVVLSPTANLDLVLADRHFTQMALLSEDLDLAKKINAELKKRWSQNSKLDGHLFLATKTQEAAKTMAKALNSEQISIIVCPENSSVAAWGSVLALTNAIYTQEPSRPYQNIKLLGLEAKLQFVFSERNEMLKLGISTWRLQGEDVFLERLVTTRTTSDMGDPSDIYRDLNTKQTLSLIRYDFRKRINENFSRHMLAKDDYEYNGPVVTKKIAKAFAISCYRTWQSKNLVQDPNRDFAKNVNVEIGDTSGELHFMLPIHVMGAWRVTHTQISFKI